MAQAGANGHPTADTQAPECRSPGDEKPTLTRENTAARSGGASDLHQRSFHVRWKD